MTQPQPQSITNFASTAREGIDALARQLVQADTAAPPALDASSLTQLAEAAESLSLQPFAESLLAAQLTIKSISAQGLSGDAAAAELVADLLLQLQAATDELEAGNTLASMSEALLGHVRELIALTETAAPKLPAAGSVDVGSARPADAERTASTQPESDPTNVPTARSEPDSPDGQERYEISGTAGQIPGDSIPSVPSSLVQDSLSAPEPAPWPTLSFSPATLPTPATTDSAEPAQPLRTDKEAEALPVCGTDSTVLASPNDPAPIEASTPAESSVAATPADPLAQIDEPWIDTSTAVLADSRTTAIDANQTADVATEPTASFDAAHGDSVLGPQSILEPQCEATVSSSSYAKTDDLPSLDGSTVEEAASQAPEFPNAPSDVAATQSTELAAITQTDAFASPDLDPSSPAEVDLAAEQSATLSTPRTEPDAGAPAATGSADNEPIDTNWQQTDEDLTIAAGSMGIGFTSDGASPMPESVDLDALNDRISELLRNAPAPTPGELTPVAAMSDPVAMADPATNSAPGLPPASAGEAVGATATIAGESTPELSAVDGLDAASAETVSDLAGTQLPQADADSLQQAADDRISGPPTGPTVQDTSTDCPPTQQCSAVAAEATLDAGGPAELTPEQMAALMAGGDDFDSGMPVSEWGSFPISLTPEQTESLQFMVADAKAGIEQLSGAITQLTNFGSRDEAAASITDIAAALDKISVTFNFTSLKIVVGLIHAVAKSSALVSDALMPEVLVRARAIHSLIEQHIRGLECGMEVKWSLDTLVTRTKRLLADKPLHPSVRGWHQGDIYRLLELDLVNESFDSPPRPDSEDQFVDDGSVWIPPVTTPEGSASGADQAGEAEKKQEAEQIIRVAATTIDSMLDLISQLVLTKNRVFNLSRTMRLPGSQEARFDELTTAADELSTLTGNLQMTMMQARMQPISKLFERYDRVVGDLAGLADKKVNLIVGGRTAMIDKNLFDGLAEAMSQLLRSIVTKQVKVPADRLAQDKPEAATISLDAESQGAQIIISIEHDGDLPDHAALAATAVEKNVCNAEALDTLSDNELFLLAFKPEFGDPQLSKVGTLLGELGGKLSARVTNDGLTRIEIALPLSVAIVPAILVGIGAESYAIPLQSVEEIIRCSDFHVSTVHGKPVIRLRDSLLDVVSATSIIGEPVAAHAMATATETAEGWQPDQQPEPSDAIAESASDPCVHVAKPDVESDVKSESNAFGLVLSAGVSRAVLTVDRIIGKQEIVIKKLEGPIANIRCFAGATIRNDGTISLIFDVAELLKAAS